MASSIGRILDASYELTYAGCLPEEAETTFGVEIEVFTLKRRDGRLMPADVTRTYDTFIRDLDFSALRDPFTGQIVGVADNEGRQLMTDLGRSQAEIVLPPGSDLAAYAKEHAPFISMVKDVLTDEGLLIVPVGMYPGEDVVDFALGSSRYSPIAQWSANHGKDLTPIARFAALQTHIRVPKDDLMPMLLVGNDTTGIQARIFGNSWRPNCRFVERAYVYRDYDEERSGLYPKRFRGVRDLFRWAFQFAPILESTDSGYVMCDTPFEELIRRGDITRENLKERLATLLGVLWNDARLRVHNLGDERPLTTIENRIYCSRPFGAVEQPDRLDLQEWLLPTALIAGLRGNLAEALEFVRAKPSRHWRSDYFNAIAFGIGSRTDDNPAWRDIETLIGIAQRGLSDPLAVKLLENLRSELLENGNLAEQTMRIYEEAKRTALTRNKNEKEAKRLADEAVVAFMSDSA